MNHIVLAVLMILGGACIIYFHNQLYKMFGDIDRAERYIGSSKAIYPLIGALLITVGVFVLFAGKWGPGDPTSIDAGFAQ